MIRIFKLDLDALGLQFEFSKHYNCSTKVPKEERARKVQNLVRYRSIFNTYLSFANFKTKIMIVNSECKCPF